MNSSNRESRYETGYSRPSIASDYTRPTSEDTDEVIIGQAYKTDLRVGNGSVSSNWVRKGKQAATVA